jgi:hypothetical protein
MKRILGLAAIALIALSVLTVTSCELIKDTASVEDTMKGFIADANEQNYDALKQYLHSSAGMKNTADYDYWDTNLTIYRPLSLFSTTNTKANVNGNGVTFVFSLEDDGGDMKIRSIEKDFTEFFN